ncbi:hypothetical protein AAG906_012079 [Vitis piasezkii]
MEDSSPSFFKRHLGRLERFWEKEFIASIPPMVPSRKLLGSRQVCWSYYWSSINCCCFWKYSRSPHGAALSFLQGCVWCDIWTGICKPLAATLQAGHLGCRGEVFGVRARFEEKSRLEKSFDEAHPKRKLTAPNLIVEKPYVRILSFECFQSLPILILVVRFQSQGDRTHRYQPIAI